MSSILPLIILLSMTVERCTFAFQPRYECANDLQDVPAGPFYLRLVHAVKINVTNEGSCPVDDLRIRDLGCMCGNRLLEQQEAIKNRLNNSCAYYNERTFGNPSPLGFCERALAQTGRCVTFEPTSSESMYTFTNASLRAKLRQVNSVLSGYFNVLDRTIVNVYLASKGHKCQCLENYKRWLCASKLTFVNSSGDADSNVSNISSSTFSSPSNDTFNLEGNVTRMRPCLSVCHDVLQICPYYLPSRFQPKPNGSEDFFQVIYGGYPAFDCPRRKYCGDNCTYGLEPHCFGQRHSSSLMITRSLLLQLLLLLVSCLLL